MIKTEEKNKVKLEEVLLHDESFIKIARVDKMRHFFMSIVSNSDHWMFIGSNGGLSAGRKNADHALFPYYTDDKLIESAEITGSKSLLIVEKMGIQTLWEPFSYRNNGEQSIERNLFKSSYGNKIIFEEIHNRLGLTYRYSWSSSDRYGFVRQTTLINHHNEPVKVKILDGVQNILPANVGSDLQRASSNLVDAYKRSELDQESGLGVFALSAVIVDKAEPSEALKANIVWSTGLYRPTILLSSLQLDTFRKSGLIQMEQDIKGEKGAYFVFAEFDLAHNESKNWLIVADVNKTQGQVAEIIHEIKNEENLSNKIRADISKGTEELKSLVASSDGLQKTGDTWNDKRHYSNVLFNIMRGGIFHKNYTLYKQDFQSYLAHHNKEVFETHKNWLADISDEFTYQELNEWAHERNDASLIRLSTEYLPLKFSRRHGDPSRPWNKFSINLRNEKDSSLILDFEGNWRDIFQNWEALAYSYPAFIEGMIFKFLNASTFDGYNPYRITKFGIDWEVIEPDDPWSYIGYWGDHQIIYLQKFLEIIEKFYPNRLQQFLDKECFVYAAVPYIIKPYREITENPKDTVLFDEEWDSMIRQKRAKMGADGALLASGEEAIYQVNMVEKLMATLLSKLSNFIPDGGIWMNTQRPEWNDANNALVGNGVSMVTLYYMRRFVTFFLNIIISYPAEQLKISQEMVEFYHSIRDIFERYSNFLEEGFSDMSRKQMLDELGQAGSDYRHQIYKAGFWGKKRSISTEGLVGFLKNTLTYIESTIKNNKRSDSLYHAYNLMTYSETGVSISYLDEMLEGQVAILSSGLLNSSEALDVLNSMKKSRLFRPDQYSYLLYPNKELPGFFQKNSISAERIAMLGIPENILQNQLKSVLDKDINGVFRFNANFNNANVLNDSLSELNAELLSTFPHLKQVIIALYEEVFNHKSFTGRSGTFFAFEGLGSIYWHMVSKLLLAVQENCQRAVKDEVSNEILGGLLDHYYEIQAGIGVHKSPELYGAFPTDPYSHTPLHKGAQQPGMTGQVKEDILNRLLELGVQIENGLISFKPTLLLAGEFLQEETTVNFHEVLGSVHNIQLSKAQLLFSICQVPIIYEKSEEQSISVKYFNGLEQYFNNATLSDEVCHAIYNRTGQIKLVKVSVPLHKLK